MNTKCPMTTYRAREEHVGSEEGGGGRGGLDENVKVAVNPQKPLDRVRHVEIRQF